MQTSAFKGFRLSLQQARLWSLQKENPACSQCVISIDGSLDVPALQQAIRDLVARHAILHTTFYTLPGMELPVQVVADEPDFSYSYQDIESLSEDAQKTRCAVLLGEGRENLRDLSRAPLLHIAVLRLANDRYLLLCSLPTLCADLATLRLLISELGEFYASRDTLEFDEPLQYADISAWQNNLLQAEEAELPLSYWRKADISQLSLMKLPFEMDRFDQSALPSGDALSIEREVDISLVERIRKVSQKYGSDLEAFMLTCWQQLLWRLTNEPTQTVGVACDGRLYDELASALGCYTRFVPLTSAFEPRRSFWQVLQVVSQSLAEAQKWQYYFSWDALPVLRDQPVPRYPVSFGYEAWPESWQVGSLRWSLRTIEGQQEPSDLHLHVLQQGEQVRLRLLSNARRLPASMLSTLATRLLTLIAGVVQTPEQEVGRLPLLLPEEQAALRPLCEPAPLPLPEEPLSRLFERQVRERGTALAVVCGDQSLSYAHLNGRANALARRLRAHGIGANALVGLHLPRSLDLLVSLLAVLKAGGAYVPIDPQLPQARQASLLAQSGPLVLLSRVEEHALLPLLPERVLVLPPEAPEESQEDLETAPSLEDLAYVLYTSGSTGTPKGVMVTQGNLLAYAVGITQRLAVASGAHWATVSTLSADLGNTAIVGGWLSGGCVHLLPYEVLTSGEALARYQQQWGLDVLKIVPSHFRALLRGCPPELREHLVPRLALVFGGERLTWELVEEVRALNESCQLYNHYGPTETTVGVLLKRIEGQEQERGAVALGRPLPNSRIYVVDGQGQVLPPGVSGELWIGGTGVAQGYLREPERTEERFVRWDPWGSGTRERVYWTGDVGRMSEAGEFSYEGRQDRQVKVRGYRVELGEIEQVLGEHEGVWESVVVFREEGEGTLVGYVMSRQQPGPGEQELRSYLRERLPEYMVPGRIVRLSALPLSRNGKIAYEELPEVEGIEETPAEERQAGRTPVEEVLEGIWQEVLGQEEIGREENFFERGGHSLLATQVISRIRQSIGVELGIGSLFEAPTIAGLGRKIEQEWQGEQERRIARVSREQDLPLSFAQQRLWFLDQLHPGSAAYNIPTAVYLDGMLDVDALEQSLRAITERHEILRTRFIARDGQPLQVIDPAVSCFISCLDLQRLGSEEQATEATRLVEDESRRIFELGKGPLFRMLLLRLQPQKHILLLNMHHIISDAWSNGVFVRELITFYKSFVEHKPLALPALPVQYADFAVWQREQLRGKTMEKQLAYWKEQLAGLSQLHLPTDYPRPPLQSYRGSSLEFTLPAELVTRLAQLSRQEGVTLFMTLIAVFQLLLSRYAKQRDVAVGTDIANRNRAETEDLIGFFVNLLIVRTELKGQLTFKQLLHRVRQKVLEAYQNQDTPFEKLVEVLQPVLPLDRMPLIQVLFVLQNVPMTRMDMPGLELSPFKSAVTSSKFDLAMFLSEQDGELRGFLVYATELFAAGTIGTMINQFATLLLQAVEHSDSLIDDLEMSSEESKAQQIQEDLDKRAVLRRKLQKSRSISIDIE